MRSLESLSASLGCKSFTLELEYFYLFDLHHEAEAQI